MRNLLAGVFLTLAALPAQASILGNWEGSSSYTDSDGWWSKYKTEFSLRLPDPGDYLYVFVETPDEGSSSAYAIKDGQVLDSDDNVIGTYTEDRIHVEESDDGIEDDDPICQRIFDFDSSGHYLEDISCDNGTFYKTEGTFSRK